MLQNMALLRSLTLKKLLVPVSPATFGAVRKAGSAWIEDYMPGEYPKNEKERRAAAEKYGLLPHEYDCYDPESMDGVGDYPKLPVIGQDHKDPFYPWDQPAFRQNFNEVWHEDWDIYTEERLDPVYEYRTPAWLMYLSLVLIMGIPFTAFHFLEPYPLHRPVCQRQFPFQGQVHYSFERGRN